MFFDDIVGAVKDAIESAAAGFECKLNISEFFEEFPVSGSDEQLVTIASMVTARNGSV